MSILQSVEAFVKNIVSEVESALSNPDIAPFVPLAEAELEKAAESIAAAHGLSIGEAQTIVTDVMALAGKLAADVQAAAPPAPVAPAPATPAPAPAPEAAQ